MDQILNGLKGVGCYLDDIVVTGKDDDDRLANLEHVLHKLIEFGIRLKESKCAFFQSLIEYLGFTVDANGKHLSASKVDANAPAPQNVQELQSFIGLIN